MQFLLKKQKVNYELLRFFVVVFLYFSNASGSTVHIGSPSMKWGGQRYEPLKSLQPNCNKIHIKDEFENEMQ